MKISDLAPWQFVALFNPYRHFVFFGGIASGKTYTGAHFVIWHIVNHPEKTGLIAANDYNQLSQVTLREVIHWLNEYGFEFVVDCQPPPHWGAQKKFKKYQNIISVRSGKHIVHIFTRVLSDPNALRGLEFSWYWCDETRDATQYAHDIILSRLRESDYIKGLITTTTNGIDWMFNRFVRGMKKGDYAYGSMHVETYDSVKYGIIEEQFYNDILASYSPMMAQQELFAKHVNVNSGRAYYAASDKNKQCIPIDHNSTLIIGCDFNFSPAMCMWVVGQITDDGIHWFREFARLETSSREMIREIAMQFGDGFFYRIFGDASGGHGTTSNAGKTDYDQIGEELSELGVQHTIDYDQANPRVKDRVENVNRLLCDGLGNVRMTYDPNGCPNLDADFNIVGWKQTTREGKGKLDNGGDIQRTHASDAIGYAVFKLFPPRSRVALESGITSEHAKLLEAF